ncbi:MAG: hypothetical protein KJZ80_14925 [Hyphomicrobiaceae bacterium]|nr:hypothetical protein [Hyphomicrobiaceae bacterium]
MEKIEHLAHASVARGCGFAMLAIATFMIGLSAEFAIALRAGGYSCLLMCFILMAMGWRAGSKPYKRTELWLMLEPAERPHATVAQSIISTARREAFLDFALRSAWLASGLLVMAVFWGFLPDQKPL